MQNYKFDYSSYMLKVRPRKKISFTIIVILIILLMGLALYIGIKPNPNQYYYFVEINTFYRYLDANNLANQIQNKGGAGYVYYDDKYHVLASFYPNKEDAEKVCENLKNEYSNASVFVIEATKFKVDRKFSDKENNVLAKLNKANSELFNNLYTIINNYDSSKEQKNQLLINIENCHSTYKSSANLIDPYFKNSKYSTSKQYILDILSCSQDSVDVAKEEDFSYKLKYNLIKIVLLHCSFLNSL